MPYASNLTLTPNPFNTSLSLTFRAGRTGIDYYIYYQASDDNINWNSETQIVVQPPYIGYGSSSFSYDFPESVLDAYSAGKYIRVRIGDYGISYPPVMTYSDYCYARKNRAPYTPTGAYTDKTWYVPGDTIDLSFTNCGDPDNNLAGFEVAKQDSNGNWYGAPDIIGSVNDPAAISIQISTSEWPHVSQWKLYVRGYDTFGVRGPWSAPTELVIINTKPLTPEITYPASGCKVYNKRPHILLKSVASNDGPKNILCVNDGTEKNTINGTGFSCGANDNLAAAQIIYIPPSDLAVGNKNITAYMYDTYLYSDTVTRAFTVSLFTPEDTDLTVSGLSIKAMQISELQTAVGDLLIAYGLSAVTWTPIYTYNPLDTTHISFIKNAASFITELQTALQSILTRINGWDTTNTFGDISVTWISPVASGGGVDRIKLRQAIEQIRSVITQI